MAYPSSVGCDLGGDQPTGYAILSACFHTPEITITRLISKGFKALLWIVKLFSKWTKMN
jgi:hypothetical protein